jgi:hypothetical protein
MASMSAQFIPKDKVADYFAELMSGSSSVTYHTTTRSTVWSDIRALLVAEPDLPPPQPKPGLFRRWFGH